MRPNTMRQVRRYHHYLGVFFAPAIFLFALSGALQTFRLHEEKGYGGTPPGWMVWIASIHRDQMLPRAKAQHQEEHQEAARPAAAAKAAPAPAPAEAPAAKRPYKLPLQIFVVLLSIGLMLSALLGVIIALNNRSTRHISLVMLAAGTVLPLLLLLA